MGAWGQTAPTAPDGLSVQEEQALSEAVVRGDRVTIHAILIAAIARGSSQTSAILRDFHRLAPWYTTEAVQGATDTFPDLKDQLESAAAAYLEPESGAAPVPQVEPAEEKSPWSGKFSVGGSYRTGRRDAMSATAGGEVTHEGKVWTDTLKAGFDYGATDGVTDTQLIEVELRTQRDFTERLYGYGLGRYDDDRFSGFSFQATEGVGIGYRLFDSPEFTLSVEGGPSLRQSKVSETGDVRNEVLGRFGVNIDWAISDTATFTNETSLFLAKGELTVVNSVNANIDERAQATNVSALDLQIIGGLGARLSYDFRYVSDPPQNGQRSTSIVKFALVHSF